MEQKKFLFNKKAAIWIYGYGFLGKPLYSRLKDYGYNVKGVIDRNSDKIKNDIDCEAILPSELTKIDEKDIVVITFQNIREHESVAEMLFKNNINKIVYLYKNTSYYPETFDLFNSLVYGENIYDFEFPFTESRTKAERPYYREYGNYVVADVPIQLVFSASLEAPFDVQGSQHNWHYNVSNVYEYKALFDLLLLGETDEKYLKRYKDRLTGTWRLEKDFLADRKAVFDNYMSEFSNHGMAFFHNSPSHADYNAQESKFILSDGHHRACFLAAMNQNYIPIRMSKQDYCLWQNSSVVKECYQTFENAEMQKKYVPILNPDCRFLANKGENNISANASAIYGYFGKKDICNCEMLSINSDYSFFERIFFRLGLSKIYSVEKEPEITQVCKVINKLEYCDSIQMCEEIPQEEYFDLVMCCNDKYIHDNKLILKIIKLCKKYFVTYLLSSSQIKEQIMKQGNFLCCNIIRKTLDNGVEMELVVFEKN